MKKIKSNNRGALFITTLMVTGVLFALASAYITSLIVQKQLVDRQRLSQQAFYAAEKGIEYAFVESQNNNWNWQTHLVDSQTKELIALPSTSLPKPTLQGPIFSAGCYFLDLSSDIPGAKFEVKAYTDPDEINETIVLSRGSVGAVTREIKFRISTKSIFSYFYFYPSEKAFVWITFDGRKKGGIYAAGNILLHEATFKDITELSTNSLGSIMKYNYKYNSPLFLDERLGGKDSRAPLPSLDAGHIYSIDNPYPWQSWSWPPYLGSWPPLDWLNKDLHFFYDEPSNTIYNVGTVNSVSLPNTLSKDWQWTKYWQAKQGDEQVQFYDATGQLAGREYWLGLEDWLTKEGPCKGKKGCAASTYFDKEFWDTKVYQRVSEAITVNFLNTAEQKDAWSSWLEQHPTLKGVVKEKNTGAKDLSLPNIQMNFSNLAKQDGLYIGSDGVWLNGQQKSLQEINWLKDGVQFFNTVRPQLDEFGQPLKENVLQFDIKELLSNPPKNGIIYIANRNSLLVNGERLPDKGLTFVSLYNFYLKGNYNTYAEFGGAGWQPSAIISNSLVYLLSGEFIPPQELPATIYPREYPGELQFIDLNNFPQKGDSSKTRAMKLAALEYECKSFFGLTSLDLQSSPAADLDDLLKKIRGRYNTEYSSKMPNRITEAGDKSSTYYVAIASPFEPTAYQLERWYNWDDYEPPWFYRPKLKGAFIRLADDAFGKGAARDIPNDYWGRRTGGPNFRGLDPTTMSYMPTLVTASNPYVEYEDKFAPESTPPGGFFTGSEEYWQELASTDYNFTHHIPTPRSQTGRVRGGAGGKQGVQGPPGPPSP